jgi:hypothetical protein
MTVLVGRQTKIDLNFRRASLCPYRGASLIRNRAPPPRTGYLCTVLPMDEAPMYGVAYCVVP